MGRRKATDHDLEQPLTYHFSNATLPYCLDTPGDNALAACSMDIAVLLTLSRFALWRRCAPRL